MSALNLVPNVAVMAAQTGVFVANYYAVKKLLLEPYLKVYDKRRSLTVGSKEDSIRLIQSNSDKELKIKSSLEKAYGDAKAILETSVSGANAEKEEIISSADAEVKSYLEEARKELASDLVEVNKQVPAMVNGITDVIFEKVLS